MDYFSLINTRKSIRNYDSEAIVDKDVLLKIVDSGRIAPSAANKQPWKFIIVSSENMLNKVSSCYHREWFGDAPHILIVVGDKSAAWTRQSDGYNSVETDVTIAMNHMILAATALGVATCWIAAFDNAKLREVMQLSENEVIYGITPLGYTNDTLVENTTKVRKTIEEVVEFL